MIWHLKCAVSARAQYLVSCDLSDFLKAELLGAKVEKRVEKSVCPQRLSQRLCLLPFLGAYNVGAVCSRVLD